MTVRYQIWRVRHQAKVLSKRSRGSITAKVEGIAVGEFRRGKEVKR